MRDLIDSDFIRKCIPNIQFEVEGEKPLPDKLAPFISAAEASLRADYLGPEDFLRDGDLEFALQYIALAAFADAVPSLDLIVTPTGFGVVNTETVAPASKERVERLIASLRERSERILERLVDRLRTYPEWQASERGRYFCTTFLSNPKDVRITGADSYDSMRDIAIQEESFIGRLFFGFGLMRKLREEYNSRNPDTFLELHELVRSVVLECVRVKMRKEPPRDPNYIWHYCQPVIRSLRNFPEYYDIWQQEMGNIFSHSPFKNDIKGAFYF